MMIKYALPFLVLMAVLAPGTGLGGLIGEPARPLVVKEWVKGQPVEIKPGTNIYVVEIWQSSIPACRAAITNLNDFQKRFKTNGVVIVGIADEPVEKIKEFVQHGYGTNIEYAIVADDRRKTALSYMTPVNQRGIPYSFVVGTNGNVLWHGLPLAGLNQALEQITAGQYDMEPFRKSEVAAHQMEQYLGLAQRGDIRAKSAGQALLANRTNDVELLCDMAYQITAAPRLAHRDFALAGEALDQAEKLAVTNKVPVMTIRAVCLFESGKRSEGMALATQALASAQSPQAKAKVQMFLQVMEARLAAAQTNQVSTNQINAVRTSDHVPVVNTNQIKGPAGKP
jgi:hypothetical protein